MSRERQRELEGDAHSYRDRGRDTEREIEGDRGRDTENILHCSALKIRAIIQHHRVAGIITGIPTSITADLQGQGGEGGRDQGGVGGGGGRYMPGNDGVS